MLHLIRLERFVLREHVHALTHNSVSLNVTHVFALLPYSARGGVMIHVRLYGLHLLLTGHIHLPFIESSREVLINIHSRIISVY